MPQTMHLPKTIEHLPTVDLTPYARNSRTHSPEQIAQLSRSMAEFGFTNPVLIDEHSTIIAGHGRVMAAQSLGLAAVPCIRLTHLSDAQRRAYVIADNKLAEQAGWDMATLARELEDLATEAFDLELVGFSGEELRGLLGDDFLPEGEAGEKPEPQPQGINYQEKYAILVECVNEQEQQRFFEKLTGEGYACKVLVN